MWMSIVALPSLTQPKVQECKEANEVKTVSHCYDTRVNITATGYYGIQSYNSFINAACKIASLVCSDSSNIASESSFNRSSVELT